MCAEVGLAVAHEEEDRRRSERAHVKSTRLGLTASLPSSRFHSVLLLCSKTDGMPGVDCDRPTPAWMKLFPALEDFKLSFPIPFISV